MDNPNLEKEVGLESQACKKLFELAKDYLTKLAHYESFISDLSSEEEESLDFLSSSFSLLRELGKVSNTNDGIDSLISLYKSNIQQTNKSFDTKKFNTLFTAEYQGDREWIDELNYIYIWTLNSYKLNLKTFSVNEIATNLNNPELEVELKDLEEQDQSETQTRKKKRADWSKGSFAIYKNLFSSKFNFGEENLDGEDGFEQIVSRTQAIERLERDIRGGKIYIYNSKPVRNLKLKKILSYLFLAGLFTSGVFFLKTCIGCIASGQYSDQNQSILFSIMSFIFFLLARNENNKYLDNENFKYAFSRKIFYYFFFLSSFFIFNRSSYTELFGNGGNGSDTFQHVISGILLFLLIVSVSFFTIAYFFLNPKKNKALIKGLLQKYTNSPNLYN